MCTCLAYFLAIFFESEGIVVFSRLSRNLVKILLRNLFLFENVSNMYCKVAFSSLMFILLQNNFCFQFALHLLEEATNKQRWTLARDIVRFMRRIDRADFDNNPEVLRLIRNVVEHNLDMLHEEVTLHDGGGCSVTRQLAINTDKWAELSPPVNDDWHRNLKSNLLFCTLSYSRERIIIRKHKDWCFTVIPPKKRNHFQRSVECATVCACGSGDGGGRGAGEMWYLSIFFPSFVNYLFIDPFLYNNIGIFLFGYRINSCRWCFVLYYIIRVGAPGVFSGGRLSTEPTEQEVTCCSASIFYNIIVILLFMVRMVMLWWRLGVTINATRKQRSYLIV